MAKVNLWQIKNDRTKAAILFRTLHPDDGGREVWVPRSVIDHVSRNPPDKHGVCLCHVTVADWFAEKEDL
jgi:hypothetical protein